MPTALSSFNQLNLKKANFDAIYRRPDPREYFRVLCGLDYAIPDLAKGIFRSVISARKEQANSPLKILDLGCSYGINSALIRYPLNLQQLAQRYSNPEMHELTSGELLEYDRHYFQAWPEQVVANFVGLDISPAAIEYGVRVGLLQSGITGDLEKRLLSARESEMLRDVDLIISTGCIGYVGHDTFREILRFQSPGHVPWVISFVLRMFSYEAISKELETVGLCTEKLEGVTFIQRRFHSEDEFAGTVNALRKSGIDPQGKEADGLLHAELFVSRPKIIVKDVPLSSLVSITSEIGKCYGRRFRSVSSGPPKLMY